MAEVEVTLNLLQLLLFPGEAVTIVGVKKVDLCRGVIVLDIEGATVASKLISYKD